MNTAGKVLIGFGVALLGLGVVVYVVAASNVTALSARLLSECPSGPTGFECLGILSQLGFWGLISTMGIVTLAVGVLLAILAAVFAFVREDGTAAAMPVAPVYMAVAPPPAPRTCTSCGAIVPPGAGFCSRCGARQ